jgi:DNA transposition AAA+ family ATPase
MRAKTAMTKDIRRLVQGVDDLLNRPSGTEGQGLLWGHPGLGKTTAIAYVANKYDGIFVRALGCWTVTSMLGDLCRELGGKRKCRRSDMVEFIVAELKKPGTAPRPILIDEADYCFQDFKMVDTLRDIYDLSKCPIILIGMEDIARLVKTKETIARRITQWVEFHGLDLDDTSLVARECCEVAISDDLLNYVHRETGGNIGRIIIALERIEKCARTNGWGGDSGGGVTLSQWGNQSLYFDQPTFARKSKQS